MTSKKGFTLIELLVVISIIGLLAGIVLMPMSKQREKAQDANIKRHMHQLRNAAEMIYDSTGTYNQICDESDDTLSEDRDDLRLIERSVTDENGGWGIKCFESADKRDFAASSRLTEDSETCWCVESAGSGIELDCPEIESARCVCP